MTIVEKIREAVSDEELSSIVDFTLADSILLGSEHSKQAFSWGDDVAACALNAGYHGATAIQYLP
jgi:hypothetical protein